MQLQERHTRKRQENALQVIGRHLGCSQREHYRRRTLLHRASFIQSPLGSNKTNNGIQRRVAGPSLISVPSETHLCPALCPMCVLSEVAVTFTGRRCEIKPTESDAWQYVTQQQSDQKKKVKCHNWRNDRKAKKESKLSHLGFFFPFWFFFFFKVSLFHQRRPVCFFMTFV